MAASSPDTAYWINAVTFLLSAVLVAMIAESKLRSEESLTRGHWRDVADGLRLLQVAKFDIPQVEGGKNFLPTKGIKRRASHCLDDFTQQNEAYVAISHHWP